MLFILGTRSYDSKDGGIDNFHCPKCSEHTQLNYVVLGRYTYLTFIPLFPVDKELIAYCDHCEAPIAENHMNAETKTAVAQVKKQAAFVAPFWTYTGSALLLAAVVFGIYSYVNAKDESQLYLQQPLAGDVYNIKKSNGYYTTYRVDQVTKDSIYVTANDYDAYLPYETDDIDTPENYSSLRAAFSRQQVVTLYNEDKIYSITRTE